MRKALADKLIHLAHRINPPRVAEVHDRYYSEQALESLQQLGRKFEARKRDSGGPGCLEGVHRIRTTQGVVRCACGLYEDVEARAHALDLTGGSSLSCRLPYFEAFAPRS